MATKGDHEVQHLRKAAENEVEEKLGQSAIFEAKQASDDEHAQTLMQALTQNRKAVFWSVMISMSIVMEGYDVILINNFFAYPEFQKKYGSWYGDEIGYQVSGPWQTGLTMAATTGAIFGGLMNGFFASKYGYRWVMIVAMGFLNCFIFVVFFAHSAAMLLVGQILCGFSWGVFATLSPAYASEVCPTNLRGYMTTYVNLCWATGQLIAAGVLRGCLSIEGEMAYRIPFAIQWLWPIPLMVISYLAPESPWFLVRKDRLDEARRSIERLSGDKTQDQINAQLAMMVHTTKVEAGVTSGVSYKDCFKGVDLRRTEICCIAFAGQVMSGSSFAYTPTYFFTTAGMNTANAFELSLGAKGMAFIGTCLSWWLITHWGRRQIYVTGMGILTVILFIIGILDVSAGKNGLWPSGGLCVFWLFIYSLTIGPITYSVISETSSTYMMNPTEWNLRGKAGFFWAATACTIFVWSFFRLPEAKGRTYEELDILFARGVPAREFSKTHVDAYASSSQVEGVHHATPPKEDL
ncbi:Maltose permease [Colletotrichum sp. SAR 10_70]|nr:Maltose permease [Colletotrichum sp. SAR 10_65]KAI8165525.1 Maltose permease [Colletotrichum sp. SAR 10_70]KAI8167748.1 Maltose permease [Colletotrichum sp. SAR 10_71]KAI8185956.1 Maltose permease [Colletotrichum sp. SAR 10_75]KAI8209334.1 Maltose permease [Colletotrichum sp. SAR 10_76]KAI8221144.1 Maltose permease [Colletotrichum sp. SAR 10_86]KAJ4996539.1 Maltose permease [Colletotrichum sp. SAR 10_66]